MCNTQLGKQACAQYLQRQNVGVLHYSAPLSGPPHSLWHPFLQIPAQGIRKSQLSRLVGSLRIHRTSPCGWLHHHRKLAGSDVDDMWRFTKDLCSILNPGVGVPRPSATADGCQAGCHPQWRDHKLGDPGWALHGAISAGTWQMRGVECAPPSLISGTIFPANARLWYPEIPAQLQTCRDACQGLHVSPWCCPDSMLHFDTSYGCTIKAQGQR